MAVNGLLRVFDGLSCDLRMALRRLGKEPGFSAVVITSLALAIGASSAAFSFMDSLFLRPFPALRQPERMLAVFSQDGEGGLLLPVSFPEYDYLKRSSRSFSSLVAYQRFKAGLDFGSEPLLKYGEVVSGDFFTTLGIEAALGRTFLPAEETPARAPIVVLSFDLWQDSLGEDPGILGRPVRINGHPYTVIGIAQQGFSGTSAMAPSAFWVPLGAYRRFFDLSRFANPESVRLFQLAGRVRPGVSVDQAASELKVHAVTLAHLYPQGNLDQNLTTIPFTATAIAPERRFIFLRAGALLSGVALMLLLMSCINTGNLLLVRAFDRFPEMAVRLALGCSRLRLLRQLSLEGLLLGMLACGMGLLIASWMRRLLWHYRPSYFAADALVLHSDPRSLAFTILVSLLATLLFGLAPALEVFKPDLILQLRARGAQRSQTELRPLLRHSALVLQVGLCLICLYCAGLFLRNLQSARRIDPGFDTTRVLVASCDLRGAGYGRTRAVAFESQLLESIRSMPGVESASLAETRLLGGWAWSREVSRSGGGNAVDILTVGSSRVGSDYFHTTGISILTGRTFTTHDESHGARVAIVNQTLAKRLWPNGNAIEGSLRIDEEPEVFQIIGIAQDAKYLSPGEPPQPFVYLPRSREGSREAVLHLHLRSRHPEGLIAQVRQELRRIGGTLPTPEIQLASEIVERSLWAPRVGTVLLSVLSALAVVIATMGVFGAAAYSVSRRRSEIGLRLALGARRTSVIGLVLGRGMALIGIGMTVGLLISLSMNRWVGFLLPLALEDQLSSLCIAAALFACVGFLANLLPALQAARLDPALPMRNDQP